MSVAMQHTTVSTQGFAPPGANLVSGALPVAAAPGAYGYLSVYSVWDSDETSQGWRIHVVQGIGSAMTPGPVKPEWFATVVVPITDTGQPDGRRVGEAVYHLLRQRTL